jgi:hypothetical protein
MTGAPWPFLPTRRKKRAPGPIPFFRTAERRPLSSDCREQRTAVKQRPYQQNGRLRWRRPRQWYFTTGVRKDGRVTTRCGRLPSTALRVVRTAFHDLPSGREWSAGHAPTGDESATASTRVGRLVGDAVTVQREPSGAQVDVSRPRMRARRQQGRGPGLEFARHNLDWLWIAEEVVEDVGNRLVRCVPRVNKIARPKATAMGPLKQGARTCS